MDSAMLITLLTLAGTIVLLVGNFIRNDITAVLIILVLMISGVLEPQEALSGFSSNAVIIIACMFIVGRAIIHTGIAQRVGDAIIKYGGNDERRLLIMLMLAAGFIGAFMSSTATAAIFIPITLTVAEKAGLNQKRLLMPLAIAALISGMMTLVATTPNIVINSVLRSDGAGTLSFFSFTPFGLLILLLAIVFMVLFGQNMLASKDTKVVKPKETTIDDLLVRHKIAKYEYLLRVPAHSDLVDKSVARIQLGAEHHVLLLAVQSVEQGWRTAVRPAAPGMVFQPEDLLMVIGSPDHVAGFADRFSLQTVTASRAQRRAFFQVVGVAEVMLNPDSTLIDKSLKETSFHSISHAMVLGIRRKGVTHTEDIGDMTLKFGDVLLVCGAWKDIVRLNEHRDKYLLLTMPKDHKEVIPARNKEKTAHAIIVAMVCLMVFNIMTPVMAILSATAAMVLTRCVPRSSIYEVIDWQTVIMIAGILPLALALQKTGVFSIVTAVFMETFDTASPLLVLTGLFLITAFLGLFISNSAVALLVAPMAVDVGLNLGISPQACAMTVAIACSSVFISPLGSPVHMLVREPGGYALKDYAKVGVPLFALALAATMFLCQILYM